MNDSVVIKGARVHNLKNIDVEIPHGSFTVITGVSGSGKTSLAFDTLFAEGQRRFIESMSSYARQFLGKLDKPDMDSMKGIAPSIAIQQKVSTNNPRSTIGTTTEIYDYLKLLYARTGTTFDPTTNEPVIKQTTSDVISYLKTQSKTQKIAILSPVKIIDKIIIQNYEKQGFKRIYINKKFKNISDYQPTKKDQTYLVIDRIVCDFSEESNLGRFADSVDMAFDEGNGYCVLLNPDSNELKTFSKKFEANGKAFQEPNINFFAFNNPFGDCKNCEGYGQVLGIDEKLVIPDTSMSVYEGAIAPWRGEVMGKYLNKLIYSAEDFDFPIHRPIQD